ncbi:hypothetical protein J4221_03640 [Candidatus Pacearchaeota archaeon]|nr:hypothetical protein [Candidatus Pacearchaeota archaeon]
MKHNLKITAIIICMFLLTQLIGLFVYTIYTDKLQLPYGMEPPEEIKEKPQGKEIIVAFAIAVALFFLLIRLKADTFIRLWFLLVTVIAISLSINAVLFKISVDNYSQFLALLIALPLAYFKIFKRDLIVHNITELLIYPGIAAVFIPLLNIKWTVIILLLISLYDMWAVWHSQFMQKMAKYQINNLKFFTGFFVPYASKKEKEKIRFLKQKYAKNPKELEKQFKKSKIKVNLAILGGGDVIFPIIASGVFYKTYLSILPSIIIMIFSTLALLFLFVIARKGKFYPAMPFITFGIYLGMIINWLMF